MTSHACGCFMAEEVTSRGLEEIQYRRVFPRRGVRYVDDNRCLSNASASPSPVSELTPELGEAATASCPCSRTLVTSFDPMSPVPPMTTIFMPSLGRHQPNSPTENRKPIARWRGAGSKCGTTVTYENFATTPQVLRSLSLSQRGCRSGHESSARATPVAITTLSGNG